MQTQHHSTQHTQDPTAEHNKRTTTHNKTKQTSLSKLHSNNEFIGNTPNTKSNTTLCIYYTNINGISPRHNYEQLNATLDNINNINADIIGFAEHNLDVS